HVRGCSRFGQVGRQNQRTGAVGLLQFGCKLPEFVRAAGDKNQVVAIAREDAGEFHSDAKRGTGDESGFAVGGGTHSLMLMYYPASARHKSTPQTTGAW